MQHLFIAGDSTAATKGGHEKPMTGWGECLQTYFNEQLVVVNYAVNGRSSKSFIDEKRLAQIEREIRENDFLAIQFGHNDSKEEKERFTEPFGSYQSYLTEYVQAALNAGATPLLVTSVTRRVVKNGLIEENTIGAYPEAMKELAQKNHWPLLDLYEASYSDICKIGAEEAKKYYLHLNPELYPNFLEGLADNTHFSELGAKRMAELFVRELRQSDLSLKEFLKKNLS